MKLTTKEDLQYLKINVDINEELAREAKVIFWEYKDLFALTYKDKKEIHSLFVQYQIQLGKDIPPPHQTKLNSGKLLMQ